MASYLDKTGLTYLWGKITTALSSKADTSAIPTTLADLSEDSTHRVVTDTEKSTWNNKGTYSKPSGGIPASDLASGVIPTNCVSSTDITNVVYLTQAAYDALATKDSNTLYVIPES